MYSDMTALLTSKKWIYNDGTALDTALTRGTAIKQDRRDEKEN